MNSATYDSRDDSLIVSSRENFVIKVDYSSGRLIWILGDPAKYWYTFASLRAKALHLPPGALTAKEVWRFDYGQTVLSQICSSVYEADNKSLLVNYAFVNGGTLARLVGLNASRQVIFDFQYPNSGCNTSWNALPIPCEGMRFQ